MHLMAWEGSVPRRLPKPCNKLAQAFAEVPLQVEQGANSVSRPDAGLLLETPQTSSSLKDIIHRPGVPVLWSSTACFRPFCLS